MPNYLHKLHIISNVQNRKELLANLLKQLYNKMLYLIRHLMRYTGESANDIGCKLDDF